MIIVSSNSESNTEDVRLRKVYTTLLARAEGKAFFRCYLLLRTRSTLHADKSDKPLDSPLHEPQKT